MGGPGWTRWHFDEAFSASLGGEAACLALTQPGGRNLKDERDVTIACHEQQGVIAKTLRFPGLGRPSAVAGGAGEREYRALVRFGELGIPAPRAHGWCAEVRLGLVRRCCLLMEYLPETQNLASWSFLHPEVARQVDHPDARHIARWIGEHLRRAHDGGVVVGSPFLKNFLIRTWEEDLPELFFIDLERTRLRRRPPRTGMRIRDLACAYKRFRDFFAPELASELFSAYAGPDENEQTLGRCVERRTRQIANETFLSGLWHRFKRGFAIRFNIHQNIHRRYPAVYKRTPGTGPSKDWNPDG